MIAILMAVHFVEQIQLRDVVICSHSSSMLKRVEIFSSCARLDIQLEVIQTLFRLKHLGISDQFLWIPAHR